MLRNWIVIFPLGLSALGCWDPPPSAAPPPRRDGLPPYEAAVCEPICRAVHGDEGLAAERLPLAPVRPGSTRALVIVPDGRLGAVDTEQLRIHLHGWGLPADFAEATAVDSALLGRYATAIVLPPGM